MTRVFQMRILMIIAVVGLLVTGRIGQPSDSVSAQITPPTATPISKANEEMLEVIEFVFKEYPPVNNLSLAEEMLYAFNEDTFFSGIKWEEADLTGDGEPEVILAINTPFFWYMSFTVLQPVSEEEWDILFHTSHSGKYGQDYRLTVEGQRLVVDMLVVNGGTGVRQTNWSQVWFECDLIECATIWSGTVMFVDAAYGIERDLYEIVFSEIIENTSDKIQIETKRLRLEIPKATQNPNELMLEVQKIIGPNTTMLYKKQGLKFEPIRRQTTKTGVIVTREFDIATQDVNEFIFFKSLDEALNEQGKIISEQAEESRASFLGIPTGQQAEDDTKWAARQSDVAAHTGLSDELGEWVASLVQAENEPLCRLTVHRHDNNTLTKVGHLDIPCLANFSQLAWVELTGDGPPELLVETLHPKSEFISPFERLYIYTVENQGLVELTTLDGYLNGTDGSGVSWQLTSEGLVVKAQWPWLSDNGSHSDKLIHANIDKGFQTYLWDVDSRNFVEQ